MDDIHITWLNQITGGSIRDWKTRAGTYQKHGRMFYQSGGQPDSWCNQDPFLGSISLDLDAGVRLIVPPPKKLTGHFLQSRSSKIDKAVGSPKLHQVHESTTEVVFCLKRNLKCLLGTFPQPPYMQVGFTPKDAKYVLVAPISEK